MTIIGRPFGQREPLTTRLHNLVRSYPKGLGVLKEFIQNADDAEADEIVFVIDERTYPTENMPETMSWMHKVPALLVFNNRTFAEADIEGIQRIGDSGKSSSVGKTGRFGLGFNACYNVTDVPCFLTGSDLHYFDPHCTTIPTATHESPGGWFTSEELGKARWPLMDAFQQFLGQDGRCAGAVFRLPFRSAEQCRTSNIKKDPYSLNDALEAVSELQAMGSRMLLFLKHVRRLRVEHLRPDGCHNVLLNIECTNSTAVAAARLRVNALLSVEDPISILDELERSGDLYANCIHEYALQVDGEQRMERWRVLDGFFIDDNRDVLAVCRKMIEHGEKAMPYAGAAWPLHTEHDIRGSVYCFLPVPMQTSLPILLNGYFDLDDSRQNMFLDASAHGSARLRVDWNRALLEKSAARAYVKLVCTLRDDCAETSPMRYYSAFPVSLPNPASWEHWLVSAFYTQASTTAVVRIASAAGWSTPGDARTLPGALIDVWDELVAERLLPIPDPSLPNHIEFGFSSCEQPVVTLTPAELRNAITVEQDIDCAPEVAPRAYLRKRGVVACLCSYCLSDHKYDSLRGLPIAIDCRGHLRVIGHTASPLYLIGQVEDPDVFCENPEWFVDPEYAAQTGLAAISSAQLSPLGDVFFLQELARYVESSRVGGCVEMSVAGDGKLSDRWLRAVFSRLLTTNVKAGDAALRALALVPDQNRHLGHVGTAATPLFFQGSADLQRALGELGVPLVSHVSKELYALMQRFAGKVLCIWPVTPGDLLDTLEHACSEALSNYQSATNVHFALLSYFSSDESLQLLRDSVPYQSKLKALRLFPLNNGELVNLSSPSFVPMDFAFPKVELQVALLDDGPAHKWRGLLLLLGVPELSRSRLIQGWLLPQLALLGQSALLEATAWIRDHLSNAQSESEAEGLLEEVQQTPMIICRDGICRPPCSVYQPGSTLAETVFGDRAFFPDMGGCYAAQPDRWKEFFRQLDMPTEPRIEDVVAHVQVLVSEDEPAKHFASLQTVYDYVRSRVDTDLANGGDLSSEVASAVLSLSAIAWIPLRKEASELLCFVPPSSAYGTPSEVFFPRVGQLVASKAPIALLRSEPNRRVREAMGFPSAPPLEMVVEHFRAVLSACQREDARPGEAVMLKALAQLYRFLGGEVPAEGVDDEPPALDLEEAGSVDLEAAFSDVACVWDQEGKRFWKPRHIYAENVRYLEPWRRTIRSTDQAIERGYVALGRRPSPSRAEWMMVLEDIAESGQSPSNYAVCGVVREVVRHIVESLREEDVTDNTVLVLTTGGSMAPAHSVLIADAPWYDGLMDSWDIELLDPRLSGIWGIQHTLGIRSLAGSIAQRLTACPDDTDHQEHRRECERLEGLVRSEEFIAGLGRLFRHQGHEMNADSLGHLRMMEVRCVQQIETCLYLREDGVERLLGDARSDSHWEHDGPVAMLSEKRARYFCDDLADLITRSIPEQPQGNLQPVVHMLRSAPEEIDGVLDDLKIRRVRSEELDSPVRDDEVPAQDYPAETGDTTDAEANTANTSTQSATVDLSRDGAGAHTVADGHETGPSPTPVRVDVVSIAGGPLGSTATRRQTGVENPIGGSPAQRTDAKAAGTIAGQPGGSHPAGNTGEASQGPAFTATAKRPPPQSGQKRLVSYVMPKRSAEEQNSAVRESGQDNDRRLRIGKAAVDIVLAHEKGMERDPESMDHENRGYDVISKGPSGTRYIEVKGTEAAWGERGVTLTRPQFFYALENPGHDFWLYVVEDVFSSTPTVHEFHRPAELVDRFVLDGGWRDQGESAKAPAVAFVLPNAGDQVLINDVVCGTVESVLRSGRFPLIIYTDTSGLEQRKRLIDVTIRSRGP